MQIQDSQIRVAATRKFDPATKQEALQRGLLLEDLEMLEIRYLNTPNLVGKLENNTSPLVFTSVHGINAFLEMEDAAHTKFTGREAFAISGNTRRQAVDAGFTILGDAPDALSLAPLIAKSAPKKLLHLTTAIRRAELYSELAKHGIELMPLEVYEKKPTPAQFGKFEALMVFSPSQMDVFLEKNRLPESCPVFCIGKTTAASVAAVPHQKIIIAEHHSEIGVLHKVYEYFNC